jgi:hypothetical protein
MNEPTQSELTEELAQAIRELWVGDANECIVVVWPGTQLAADLVVRGVLESNDEIGVMRAERSTMLDDFEPNLLEAARQEIRDADPTKMIPTFVITTRHKVVVMIPVL